MNEALSHPLYIALKASIAALIALAGVHALHVGDTLSAPFVAVVCISPTVYTGARRGLEQIAGSLIGGAITYALTFVLPKAAVLGVSLFFTIWLCYAIGFSRAVAVAAFTVLYILVLPGDDTALTLRDRIASVAIGVVPAIGMNLVVSSLRHRSVFARRLVIARQQIAAELTRLSDALGQRVIDVPALALFENAFPLLRTLFEEVSDAERDSRLRGGRAREAFVHAQHYANDLITVAHYGKDASLILADAPGPHPDAATWAASLADALMAGAPLDVEGRICEAPLKRSLSLASRAWNRCFDHERAFTAAARGSGADARRS